MENKQIITSSSSKRNKQGSVLILVVGLFAIFIVLFLALSSLALRTSKDTALDINRQQAFLNAKSVLQAFVEEVKEMPEILNNLTLPLTTSATITEGAKTHVVQLQIRTVNNNPNKIEVTTTSVVNEQTGTLSALFERGGSGSGGTGSPPVSKEGWVTLPANSNLFYYAFARRSSSLDKAEVENTSINGDLYSNNRLVIKGGVQIDGDVVANIFTSSTSSKQFTGYVGRINGNLFVNKIEDSIDQLYVNGNAVLNISEVGNANFNRSVVTKNVFVEKANQIQLHNTAFAGSLYRLQNTGEIGYTQQNSIVYGDVFLRHQSANVWEDKTWLGYIKGYTNLVVPNHITKLLTASNLRNVNGDFTGITQESPMKDVCTGVCQTGPLQVRQTYTIPAVPQLPPTFSPSYKSAPFPNTTINNAFTCSVVSSKWTCTHGEIRTNDKPVYVKADVAISTNPYERYYIIDSSKITGTGDVYFIFNEQKRFIFPEKVGYTGNVIDNSRNLYFLFGPEFTNYLDIMDKFNGYIYTDVGRVRLKSSEFSGAINSYQTLVCDSNLDSCNTVSASEQRLINYRDPVNGDHRNFVFQEYR